jgi:hypothetical protein
LYLFDSPDRLLKALFVTLKASQQTYSRILYAFNEQANGVVYERIQRFVIGYTIFIMGFLKNPNPSNWNLILTIVILRNLPNQINFFPR